jgi:hypothetical protein
MIAHRDLFGPEIVAPEGVVFDERYRKWRAFIVRGGREIVLGRFNYIQSACTVRKNAEEPRLKGPDLFFKVVCGRWRRTSHRSGVASVYSHDRSFRTRVAHRVRVSGGQGRQLATDNYPLPPVGPP